MPVVVSNAAVSSSGAAALGRQWRAVPNVRVQLRQLVSAAVAELSDVEGVVAAVEATMEHGPRTHQVAFDMFVVLSLFSNCCLLLFVKTTIVGITNKGLA